jgi:hypothetical protein
VKCADDPHQVYSSAQHIGGESIRPAISHLISLITHLPHPSPHYASRLVTNSDIDRFPLVFDVLDFPEACGFLRPGGSGASSGNVMISNIRRRNVVSNLENDVPIPSKNKNSSALRATEAGYQVW